LNQASHWASYWADYNINQARVRMGNYIANSRAAQDIMAFERFLFLDVPMSFAGGELAVVGWRALGVGRFLANGAGRMFMEGESSLVPQIGKKLDFVFGKATGRLHNIQRSITMERQLNSIGIFDNAAGNSYLRSHLGQVLNNSKSILSSEGGFVTRESLLMGPNGGLQMQSVWKGQDLISIVLKGR